MVTASQADYLTNDAHRWEDKNPNGMDDV